MRADQLLVERGLAASRAQAQRLIASGVNWRVGGTGFERIGKNSETLPPHAELVVLDDAESRYVSRGGLKLEGALQATGLTVSGWHCLDVGQSTGGFTDCLLRLGAAQVVGLDVGHGQLHPSLQQEPRVVCIEGLNARELQPGDARIPMPTNGFALIVGDVSFISLTLVLPALVPFLHSDGQMLLLAKPQFELQPSQLGKGGIVRDAALYAEVERRLRACCVQCGLAVNAWLDSPITGGDGNREFFIHASHVKA